MKTVYLLVTASALALMACVGDDPYSYGYPTQDATPSQRVQVAPNENPKNDAPVDSPDAAVQVDAGQDAPDAPPVVEPVPDAGPDVDVPVEPVPDAGSDSGPEVFDSNVTKCDINDAFLPPVSCQLDVVPSWREPHAVADKCSAVEIEMFWQAAFGPEESTSNRVDFAEDHGACNSCILSRTTDAAWGPAMRTPGNHFTPNVGGCRKTQVNLMTVGKFFPPYEWKFEQCVIEKCDGETTQANFAACRELVKTGACSNAKHNADSVDSRMGESATFAEYQAIASCGTSVYGPNAGGGEDVKSRFVASATVMCGL